MNRQKSLEKIKEEAITIAADLGIKIRNISTELWESTNVGTVTVNTDEDDSLMINYFAMEREAYFINLKKGENQLADRMADNLRLYGNIWVTYSH